MAEVVWTEIALSDMKSLVLFISRDSNHYAKVFSDRIFSISDSLCDYPERGRVVPELDNQEIREILCGQYRLIYRIRKTIKKIEILAVIHGSMVRDLSFLLDQ
ncbi:MAG: type II toxin-antitoxin system RelE/ParE family toxin [Vulcanimicrobiota bacterium]